jgi:hypothetical protein
MHAWARCTSQPTTTTTTAQNPTASITMEPCAKKMRQTSLQTKQMIEFKTLGVLGNEEGSTLMEMIMEFLKNDESLFYAALTCKQFRNEAYKLCTLRDLPYDRGTKARFCTPPRDALVSIPRIEFLLESGASEFILREDDDEWSYPFVDLRIRDRRRDRISKDFLNAVAQHAPTDVLMMALHRYDTRYICEETDTEVDINSHLNRFFEDLEFYALKGENIDTLKYLLDNGLTSVVGFCEEFSHKVRYCTLETRTTILRMVYNYQGASCNHLVVTSSAPWFQIYDAVDTYNLFMGCGCITDAKKRLIREYIDLSDVDFEVHAETTVMTQYHWQSVAHEVFGLDAPAPTQHTLPVGTNHLRLFFQGELLDDAMPVHDLPFGASLTADLIDNDGNVWGGPDLSGMPF